MKCSTQRGPLAAHSASVTHFLVSRGSCACSCSCSLAVCISQVRGLASIFFDIAVWSCELSERGPRVWCEHRWSTYPCLLSLPISCSGSRLASTAAVTVRAYRSSRGAASCLMVISSRGSAASRSLSNAEACERACSLEHLGLAIIPNSRRCSSHCSSTLERSRLTQSPPHPACACSLLFLARICRRGDCPDSPACRCDSSGGR